MSISTNKLIGKIFITGKIVAETGLHIGGSKTSLDIGGLDLNVIKTPKGEPFIPGSSLKGKLRSMLARTEGSLAVNIRELDKDTGTKMPIGIADEHFTYMNQLFGQAGDDNDKGVITRLVVRDASLDVSSFEETFASLRADMDDTYTVVKWENTIDRKKGTAEHPRQLERVPAGAKFDFELVYDLYEDAKNLYSTKKSPHETYKGETTVAQKHAWSIFVAMKLLQDDYLGGQGSRGYGQIKFEGVKISQKSVDHQAGKYETVEQTHEAFALFNNFGRP